MKNLMILVILAVVLAACTQKTEQQPAEETPAPQQQLTTEETRVKALVDRAVERMVAEGTASDEARAAVFAQFNAPDGEFVDGDLYLFVYNFDGVVLAHEATPTLIGQNLIDKQDADGVKMIADMVRIAQEDGAGWIDYQWPFPGSQEILPKRAFVARPGELDMFIGCGFYPTVDKE